MIYNLFSERMELPGVKHIVFPDGQEHFERGEGFICSSNPIIQTRLASSADIMRLLHFADFLSYSGVRMAELRLGYVQGARMDRRINHGTFTAKVVADLINNAALEWSRVWLFDPHSDVLPALINNAHVLDSADLVSQHIEHFDITPEHVILVAPDAGASKKVGHIGRALSLPVVQGMKKRDTNTGELSGFGIEPHGEVPKDDAVYIIVDDICDGGGTFLGLSDAIRDYWGRDYIKPNPVDLVVSHGIFSKGFASILLNGIRKITTTDSYSELAHGRGIENVHVVEM